MKPVRIDFAPPRPAAPRLRWFAGGAGALVAAVASAVWLLMPHAEAGRMGEAAVRALPTADEAQAVDAAVRRLNFPWIDAIVALESACADPTEARLSGFSSDRARSVLRVSGEARSTEAAQALAERLNTAPPVSTAALQTQEQQAGATTLPVRFALELHLKDPA